MPAKFKDLCLDATNDRTLAQWWCTAMGYTLRFAASENGVEEWAARG
jgi:hypothetical protein